MQAVFYHNYVRFRRIGKSFTIENDWLVCPHFVFANRTMVLRCCAAHQLLFLLVIFALGQCSFSVQPFYTNQTCEPAALRCQADGFIPVADCLASTHSCSAWRQTPTCHCPTGYSGSTRYISPKTRIRSIRLIVLFAVSRLVLCTYCKCCCLFETTDLGWWLYES